MPAKRDAAAIRIPGALNLALAALQVALLLAILWAAGRVEGWLAVAALSVAYGVVRNSAYAMLHEGEHNLLHPDRRVNHGVATLLALFFPAPFHLIRQGHIGHHIRNRSDDEAFDLYFEGEHRFWKYLQLYGTLTGMFWVLIAITNVIIVVYPPVITANQARFDRTTQAFAESLNPRYRWLIYFEALAVLVLHGAILYVWQIPIARYLAVLFGFGFMWSAMQYAHHYGTVRDVQKGARNLKTVYLLDLVWLNHNWHLNHHMKPTVPWVYLPFLGDPAEPRGSLVGAYFRMWRGPQLAHDRVQNRYAGKVIN
jgi:fatty acid desaturase